MLTLGFKTKSLSFGSFVLGLSRLRLCFSWRASRIALSKYQYSIKKAQSKDWAFLIQMSVGSS